MSRTQPSPKRPGTPDERFRGPIQTAVSEGVAVEDMTLRLTLRDTDIMRRDPKTPVADVSFAGGVMRFLGVRIEQGGVPESVLERRSEA